MTDAPREIPLGKSGAVALVDAADYEWLSQWKWSLHTGGYAFRKSGHRSVYMHRLIMEAGKGTQIDHRNVNKLDNRRANLRFADRSLNARNRGRKHYCLATPATSAYKGVSLDTRKSGPKWVVNLKVDGKRVHFRRFHREEDAARAYDAAVRERFGDSVYTNFPLESAP